MTRRAVTLPAALAVVALLPLGAAQAAACTPTASATADLLQVQTPPLVVPLQAPQAATARSDQRGEGQDSGSGALAATSTPVFGGASVLSTGTGRVSTRASVLGGVVSARATAELEGLRLTLPGVAGGPVTALDVSAFTVEADHSPDGQTANSTLFTINGTQVSGVSGFRQAVPGVGLVETGTSEFPRAGRTELTALRITTDAGFVVTVGRVVTDVTNCASLLTV